MGGLAGILDLSDRRSTSNPAQVERMSRVMRHRALHSGNADVVAGAPVFVGVSSEPPATRGHLSVLADIRLDDAAALCAALNLPRPTSPGRILLAAYERWGANLVDHLSGDFAFALWDAHSERLLCVRDHFGVKPFYFARHNGKFAFASEPKALFALGLEPQVDEAAIAAFLVGLPRDPGRTSFADLHRLAPATALTVSHAGLSAHQYWALSAKSVRPRAVGEEFLGLLTTAVRRRIDGEEQVAAMLSGGLDSSSLTALAARELAASDRGPLKAISLVPDDPAGGERPYIDATLRHVGCASVFGPLEGASPFKETRRLLAEQDELYGAPLHGTSHRLYRIAAENGCRVILDGHGGDEVVSFGWGLVRDLARTGRFVSLWRDLRVSFDQKALATFTSCVAAYNPAIRSALQLKAKILRTLRSPRPAPAGQEEPFGMVRSDLAKAYDLKARLHANVNASVGSDNEQERHLAQLAACPFAEAFELLDRSAAFAGVEARYPFFDKDVVAFCVSLPVDEKRAAGVARLPLRRAMSGLLPDVITRRLDKFNFGATLARDILVSEHELLAAAVLDDRYGVSRYVDMNTVRRAYDDLIARQAEVAGANLQILWRAVTLGLWLDHVNSLRAPARGAA